MPQTQNRQPSQIDQLLIDYTSRRLDEEADRQGVPRDFARRALGAESGGQADVIRGRRLSSAGAIGPMQLMPGTAADLGVDPYNIDENIEGGVRYLKRQLDSFGGDRARAAAAYNWGPGNVRKRGLGQAPAETRAYVKKVAGAAQGGSEIDNLYGEFYGRPSREVDPDEERRSIDIGSLPKYDERGRRKIGPRDVGITPVEWPEGKVLRTSTGEFIDPSEQSKYEPPRSLRSLRPDARSDQLRSLRPSYPNSGTGELVPPAPPRPLTPREKRLADDENARVKATPAIARMVEDFEALKREGSLDAARSVAAKIKQRYGEWMETGADANGWPYVKSKVRGWNPIQPVAHTLAPEEALERRRVEFERLPWTEQVSERAYDALARGGGELSRLARRAAGVGMGAVQALQGGKFEVVDPRPVSLRRWEDERARELAERRERYRPSLAADVGEGILEGAGPAGAGAATGGSLPATMAVGGGMSALGADWEKDPERAAAQTVLGAVAPVVGGKVGSVVGGRVAARLAPPAAQAAARALGEIVGGGAGNVLQSGTEQAVFEGQISPREMIKQGLVGSALSAPGAIAAAGRPAPEPPARATQPLPAVIPAPHGEAAPARRLTPPAEQVRVTAGLPVVDTNAPTAELPARAQDRTAATLRAPGNAGRAPASEVDALYDEFATLRGKALPKQAGEPETPAVIHPNPEIDRKPILAKTQDDRVIVENPNNKSGVSVVKDRSGSPAEHKFSSTQADLPKDLADEITAFGRRIPDRDLAVDGRETTPHITLKYGLHGWDPKIAQEALAGEGPIKVKFGKVSVFHNKDADVVKVDIDSPDLHRLNQKIAGAHPNTETHQTYEPHATIAYVRPGQGAKYAGDNFLEGRTVTMDRITFSGRDGKQVEIPLTGQKASAPAESAKVAGEPVSPRWLNAQRRQAAELLGFDPDQIPMADEASVAALQNLQTPQVRADVGPSAAPAAAARTKSGGHILGGGFGALQPLFERAGRGKPPKASKPEPTGRRG